jgi:hypothetical protein
MTSQPPEYLEAPRQTMVSFLEQVDERHGSMEEYVTGLGVDEATIDRLRSTIIE